MSIDGYVIPEKEILATTMAILQAWGVYCWRNNTGMLKAEHKGKTRVVRFGHVGSSDILGVLPDGRLIAVETKRLGEKPTEKQLEFMRAVNSAGGCAFWLDDTSHLPVIMEAIRKGYRIDSDIEGNRLEPREAR